MLVCDIHVCVCACVRELKSQQKNKEANVSQRQRTLLMFDCILEARVKKKKRKNMTAFFIDSKSPPPRSFGKAKWDNTVERNLKGRRGFVLCLHMTHCSERGQVNLFDCGMISIYWYLCYYYEKKLCFLKPLHVNLHPFNLWTVKNTKIIRVISRLFTIMVNSIRNITRNFGKFLYKLPAEI